MCKTKVTGKLINDLDVFFITRDGELVSIKNSDKMFSIVANDRGNIESITGFLWCLAEDCLERGYLKAAYDYLGKILSVVDAPGEKARCLLRMAVTMEQMGNYQEALNIYLQVFVLPQESQEIRYFLHNNTGYCLNQIGNYQEAEKYCQTAILIDPDRHNAYKNLGIALQNEGRFADAARSFIQATRLCPTDTRTLAHLQDLIGSHKEILEEMPELLSQFYECYEAVQSITGQPRLQ